MTANLGFSTRNPKSGRWIGPHDIVSTANYIKILKCFGKVNRRNRVLGWADINGPLMYQDCWLHSIATRFGSIAAQDRKEEEEKTGFAFVGCRVTGTGPLYVGRAMGQYSRIVYSYTYFDDIVAHGGWDDWDHADNKNK